MFEKTKEFIEKATLEELTAKLTEYGITFNDSKTALDRFQEYLESISDEQLKEELIELGVEE